MRIAREYAELRVLGEPALDEYRFFILNDPLMTGPSRFAMPYTKRELRKYEQHFSWVCSADTSSILEWAVMLKREYINLLKERIKSSRSDVAHMQECTTEISKRRQLMLIEDLINRGATALEKDYCEEAASLFYETLRSLKKYATDYHLEPLVRTGKRVRDGGKKGHESKWGTKEEKTAICEEYKILWIELQKTNMSINQRDETTAKHFSVSKKTIQRYRK